MVENKYLSLFVTEKAKVNGKFETIVKFHMFMIEYDVVCITFPGKILAVTADDLLPILECLVIKSDLPNW